MASILAAAAAPAIVRAEVLMKLAPRIAVPVADDLMAIYANRISIEAILRCRQILDRNKVPYRDLTLWLPLEYGEKQ